MYESLAKIKLLYVEDDENISSVLSDIFGDEFKELYVAKDGQEGLSMYKKYAPDIVLTDINMPKMNGIEMSELIRSENSTIPIVISSAFRDDEYIQAAKKLDINHYILKPINLEKLLDILENLAKEIEC